MSGAIDGLNTGARKDMGIDVEEKRIVGPHVLWSHSKSECKSIALVLKMTKLTSQP